MKNRGFSERISFALAGLSEGWRRERSFRTQAVIAVLMVAGLVLLRAPAVWCALVSMAIALVLAAELFNAALEALVDRLHPERHPEIRVVKDMAAGSVLLVSLGAVAVGVIMLLSIV